MMRSYLAVYLLLSLALVLHCNCRIQFSEAIACPGEIVTITCTTPTRTHQWMVLDLNIHRGLAAADWNRVVPPDFPFQFRVINVMQNGSIRSTGTVNFTANLNGTTLSCRDGYLRFPIEQRTTIMLKAPPGPPGVPFVTFPIAGERFQYTWDAPVSDFDFYLINISGPDNQCGSRGILHRSTESSYTCSGWSPAGQNYTLSVQAANCGGEGPASGPVTVFLQKPNRPALTASPIYGSSGRLLEIESQANAGPPKFIADGVDNSNEYIFTYDSGSDSLNFTHQCNGSSCQHTFSVPNSSQVQQYTVSVSVRNVVGVGTASAPVTIGMMNEALAVHPDVCIPEITCQFLDGPVGFASCAISYSTDQTYANLSNVDSANGMNVTNLTVALSTELHPNTRYYYAVHAAVGDSIQIQVRGTLFVTDQLCEETPQPLTCTHCGVVSAVGFEVPTVVVVVSGILVTVTIVIIILCICYRRKRRTGVRVESDSSETDGPAEEGVACYEKGAASVPLIQAHEKSPPRDSAPQEEATSPSKPLIGHLSARDKNLPSGAHPRNKNAREDSSGPDPSIPEEHSATKGKPDSVAQPDSVEHPDSVAQPAPERPCDATQDVIGCASSEPGLAHPEETQVEKQDDPGLNVISEPCVRQPPQPGTAEETEQDSPGMNAQVLQPSFSRDVMYRLSSISGEEATTEKTPIINNAAEESSFINDAVMEIQGAAMGSLVNRMLIVARTPGGQSLGRSVEGIQVPNGGHYMYYIHTQSLHTQQYLGKRENKPPPEVDKTENRNFLSFFEIWKLIVEKTELSKYHIRVADMILSKISEHMWLKEQVFKEVLDLSLIVITCHNLILYHNLHHLPYYCG